LVEWNLVDQPRPGQGGDEAQLHPGVAASLLDVARGAVHVQVRPDPGLERSVSVVGVYQPGLVGSLRTKGFFEHPDVFERAELVVDGAAVIPVAVELAGAEAQDEAGRAGMAEETLGTGGEPPCLLAPAARLGRVENFEFRGRPRAGNE